MLSAHDNAIFEVTWSLDDRIIVSLALLLY